MSDSGRTINPPPATPPPPAGPSSVARHRLDLPLLVGGLALTAVAIVLLVLGLLAFSSASSARDDADRFAKERRAAENIEGAAEGDIKTVVEEGNNVANHVDNLRDAANQLTQKDNDLGNLLDAATDRFNAGDERGANATVSNEGRQILSEEQNLKAQENQALTEVQEAQNKLKEALAQ